MMPMRSVTMHADIRQAVPGFRLGVWRVSGVRGAKADNALQTGQQTVWKEIQAAFPSGSITADPVVQGVRAFYRACGMDPTRYRPSSERLLRRIVRGNPPATVSPAVDICNRVSAEFRVPFGLYDDSKITGSLEVRVGRDAESYLTLTGALTTAGGKIILSDGAGIIGGPTIDSERTKVEPGSTTLLLLVYAPPALTDERLLACGARYTTLMTEFCGAEPPEQTVIT